MLFIVLLSPLKYKIHESRDFYPCAPSRMDYIRMDLRMVVAHSRCSVNIFGMNG